MKKTTLILFIVWTCAQCAFAQTTRVSGAVSDAVSGEKIPGVVIVQPSSSKATVSDQSGDFVLDADGGYPVEIIVRFVGYQIDTLQVVNDMPLSIKLRNAAQLKGAEVTATRQTTEISTLQPRNIELLNEGELLKAACCNLSESFETNPSVDVNYTDAVTGAKEIQLLGLSGLYTQMLGEAIPTLRGMANSFGLMYVPGSWMESIQISKGAGSVSSGYEGITGQINIEYKKPLKPQPLMHVNLYADAFGRGEINTIFTKPFNKKWSYMFMGHASGLQRKVDHNDDRFLDMPLYRQLNVYNRLHFNSGREWEGQFGVKAMAEERQGGVVGFDPDKDKLTTNAYGIGINTRRGEIYGKLGKVFTDNPNKSMGIQLSGIIHDQDAYFGLRTYNGQQTSVYFNALYMDIIRYTDHKFKTGVDFKYDLFDESVDDSSFSREEIVPGVHFEYTYGCASSKFGAIAGLRFDYHNLFGLLWTPRVNLKYNFTDDMILRASLGKGYRTPNVYADNIGLFVSAKDLVVLEKIQMEEAWNGGLNFTTRFKWWRREASLMLDAYRTVFVNQWITDQFSSSDVIFFYNLKGSSSANSLQATFTYEPILGLTTKLAWRFDDVRTDYLLFKDIAKPLIARNKFLVNAGYITPSEKWRLDATLQWEGPKNLPMAAGHNHSHSHQNEDATDVSKSPSFYQVMAQITRIFKVWEVYLGAENLLNYTQHQVILGADNPFGNNFDATQVWGPVMGTRIYAGVRLNINASVKP